MNPAEVQSFAQKLTAIQRSLYLYVVGLLHSPVDAEDVLQEANRVLWEKCEEYRPGSNFAAWAHKIAYFEVLAFYRRRQRDRLRFGEVLIEQLAQEMADESRDVDSEQAALVGCLERLRESDRELISLRYLFSSQVRDLAGRLKRSEKSIYQSLARIRLQLLECVRVKLAAEGRA